MTNKIDAIIDGQEAYAYGFMTKSDYGYGDRYGHMTVNINLANKCDWMMRRPGVIKITCQIGSTALSYDEQCQKPYAFRYGYDSNGNEGSLDNLKAAVAALTKIEKYMAKVENDFGYAENFADYCQRVMLGAGVKHFISEPTGWSNGGHMRDKDLDAVSRKSREKLDMMVSGLMQAFARKAA